jgi:tetratricopeptide (TPR) repeat protein
VRDASDWAQKYRDLSKRLDEQAPDDDLSKRASMLLRDGELDDASALLDQLLQRDETRVDRAALHHFERGMAYILQWRLLDALPHFQKAYQYRPDDASFGYSYGLYLLQAGRTNEAISVLTDAVSRARARLDPQHPDDLFKTLSALGLAAKNEQFFEEAEKLAERAAEGDPYYLMLVANALGNEATELKSAGRQEQARATYLKELEVARRISSGNPRYYDYVLSALNGLINLCFETKNYREAEAWAHQSLDLSRQLVTDEHLPTLFMTWRQLANAYEYEGKISSAESAELESNRILRVLAARKPATWRDAFASSLDHLGALRFRMGRFSEAEKAYVEALAICRTAAREKPDRYQLSLASELEHVGDFFRDLKQFDRAELLYEEMVVRTREGLGRVSQPPAMHDVLAYRILSLADVRIRRDSSQVGTCALIGEAVRLGKRTDIVAYARSRYEAYCKVRAK